MAHRLVYRSNGPCNALLPLQSLEPTRLVAPGKLLEFGMLDIERWILPQGEPLPNIKGGIPSRFPLIKIPDVDNLSLLSLPYIIRVANSSFDIPFLHDVVGLAPHAYL